MSAVLLLLNWSWYWLVVYFWSWYKHFGRVWLFPSRVYVVQRMNSMTEETALLLAAARSQLQQRVRMLLTTEPQPTNQPVTDDNASITDRQTASGFPPK